MRLTNGEAIYAEALRQATTTNFTPDEVHQMGLHQVAEISAEIDRILRGQGYTQGSVGERLQRSIGKRQLYADSDAGRAELLAYLNDRVKDMYGRLPQAFATLPRQPLEIRRVPPEIQDGAVERLLPRRRARWLAAGNLLHQPEGAWRLAEIYAADALLSRRRSGPSSADQHRPGVEGHSDAPQDSAASRPIPKAGRLYAEQLADELGVYASVRSAAPASCKSFLFRAARLVVDTGIHSKRWSREQATDYMVRTTGYARARSQREVERYCTPIGQACSYKVGHTAWMRARDEAKSGSARSSISAVP